MSNKQYYVTLPDKAQEGPYDEKDLITRFQAGKYPEGTLIWCDGMESWKSIADVFKPIDVQSLPSLISPARQQSCSHNLPLAVWIIGSAILDGGVGFSIASLLHQPSEKIIYLEKPILRGTEKQEVESKLLHQPSEKIVYLEKPISRETEKQEAESKQNIKQDQNISTNDSAWDKAISEVEGTSKEYTNEKSIERSKRLLSLLKKIKNGADINTKHTEYSESALNLAVDLELASIVKLLCEKGINVNFAIGSNYPPLSKSCQKNNVEIAKILLKAGADPNNGVSIKSPLWLAVMKDNTELLQLLLQSGADPMKYEPGGFSSLYKSCNSKEMQNILKNHHRLKMEKSTKDLMDAIRKYE